jgi:carbon monoxide dehydrogenase subunit G
VADSSTSSIVIDATPEAILAVIADFESYPAWATSVRSCTPVETNDDGSVRLVKFVIDAGIVRDEYINEYEWSGPGSVSWHMTEGKMQKSQRGSYETEVVDAGDSPKTKVTYSLSVELAVPMLGLLKRKAEKMIMDTALKELKRRVEAQD